jgi:ribosomal protein L36
VLDVTNSAEGKQSRDSPVGKQFCHACYIARREAVLYHSLHELSRAIPTCDVAVIATAIYMWGKQTTNL